MWTSKVTSDLVLVDLDVAHQADLEAGDADLLALLQATGVGERGAVLGAGEERQPAGVEGGQQQHQHQHQPLEGQQRRSSAAELDEVH